MKPIEGIDASAPAAPQSPIPGEVECSDDQPLRTLSADGQDEVEDFAALYGLAHKLELFKKAASLLHSNCTISQLPDATFDEISALEAEETHKWHQPRLLYFTIFICSLGAVEQGWAQTAMNGANLYFPAALGIGSDSSHDTFIVGLINSGLYLSVGLWGAWLSDPFNNRFGRRGTVFAGNALCLIGNVGCALSWNWPALLFFRLLLGTGLGLIAATTSIFAAESAPAYIRGGLAVSWQMLTAFGIWLGFLANVGFYGHGENVWRMQLAAPALPSIPLLMLIYACPESAGWYVKRGYYDRAFESLVRLRNTELQAAREVYSIYLSRTTTFNGKPSNKTGSTSKSLLLKVLSLLTISRNRHAFFGSYAVMFSQQLCGINIVAFYSSTIFASSGFSALAALWASVIFGFINFVFAFPAVWTMDSLGRRRLLLWTLPPMALTMAATGLTFNMPKGSAQLWLLAGLIYLFCALYSPGMGPVPCAYSAEVFPLNVREVGMSAAIATANFWAAVLSVTFPALLEGLGQQGTFELYAALNLVAWGLCWVCVRETKGRTLEGLDEVFEGGVTEFVRQSWRESSWLGRREKPGYVEVEQEEEGDS